MVLLLAQPEDATRDCHHQDDGEDGDDDDHAGWDAGILSRGQVLDLLSGQITVGGRKRVVCPDAGGGVVGDGRHFVGVNDDRCFNFFWSTGLSAIDEKFFRDYLSIFLFVLGKANEI